MNETREEVERWNDPKHLLEIKHPDWSFEPTRGYNHENNTYFMGYFATKRVDGKFVNHRIQVEGSIGKETAKLAYDKAQEWITAGCSI